MRLRISAFVVFLGALHRFRFREDVGLHREIRRTNKIYINSITDGDLKKGTKWNNSWSFTASFNS